MKIAISRKKLVSLLNVCAEKDVRFYLNGAMFEYIPVSGEKTEYRLVATDGHVLGCWRGFADDEAEIPQTAGFNVIIPVEVIKAIKKDKRESVYLESMPDGRFMLGDIAFCAIGGVFPDYRRVIPKSCTGTYYPCDSRLESKFQDVWADYSGKRNDRYRVRVAHNAAPLNSGLIGQACLVTIDDEEDFIGVLMPVKMDAADLHAPTWI